MEALADARLPFVVGGGRARGESRADREVDVYLASEDAAAADELLCAAGLRRHETVGTPWHRFYLCFDRDDGRWSKLDVKLVPGPPIPDLCAREEDDVRRIRRARIGAAHHLVGGVRAGVARRRPLHLRRAGPVIAIVGPAGSGKSTIIESLRSIVPVAVSARHVGATSCSRHSARRDLGRSVRLLPAYMEAWRGDIVLCDGHPLIEHLALREPRRSILGSLGAMLVRRLVPWPDALVLLDAPPEALHHRRPAHSPELLEHRLGRYRREIAHAGATVVSTSCPLGESVARVSTVVWEALRARRG